jgi:hypothetical protein
MLISQSEVSLGFFFLFFFYFFFFFTKLYIFFKLNNMFYAHRKISAKMKNVSLRFVNVCAPKASYFVSDSESIPL